MGSQRWSLNTADWQRWFRNLLIFSTPAVIIFLTALSNGVGWQKALYVLYTAIINALLDLFLKLQAQPKNE